MRNYNDEDLLGMVELYASENGLIADEAELSYLFDKTVLPDIVAAYGEDDEPAINEGFCNWSDMLCKDGEIHPIQYDQYCYTGKLS